MGLFLAVSAFQDASVESVADAVGRHLDASGVRASAPDGGEPAEDDEAQVFPPVKGWTMVFWPPYFTVFDGAATADISGRLGVLASTVHIYDGDYWAHLLFRDGVELDRFASMPDYFTEDPDELAELTREWAGNPAVVAEAFGRPVDQVAPYFVPIPAEGRSVKAFADDETELDDVWVFVDFWRRLGIIYEQPATTPATRVRLVPGWLDKLPVEQGTEL